MNLQKYFFFFATILGAGTVYGQSGNVLTQTFTWHSVSGYDVIASDSTSEVMKFTTVENDRIEHRNHANTLQTFDIVSTDGSWTDVDLQGSITYTVSINGQSGKIKIERTGEGIFLTIDFSQLETEGVKLKFIVNQIE